MDTDAARLRILAAVRRVPAGCTASYGEIARRAGLPKRARLVAKILSTNDDPDLPWWRVVRADGSLAKANRQRALLAAEGVPFRGERVDMSRARVAG